MNRLEENSNQILQEEIRRAIREKLNRFVFPCPHCQESISDEHFGKEQRAFGYINEVVRKVLEEQIIPQWNNYREVIVKELEQQKIYENFPAFKELKEIVKIQEKKIVDLQSEERIENSLTVKRLREEKKEIDSKYSKKFDDLQLQSQDLQKQVIAKEEQIKNLLFRQKDHRKGLDFEHWFLEKLGEVFNDRDNIIDVSKGQSGLGKKGDFLQEVFTEGEPRKLVGRIIYETKNTEKWSNDWVPKLEKDMETHRADYGFIVATCESDNSIRPLDIRKKIYVSGDNSNIFIVAKIMRELLIAKSNFENMIKSDEKEQKLKKLRDWIEYKLPRYVSTLEDKLNSQEKQANIIIREAEKIKDTKGEIWQLTIDKMISEIKSF